MQERAARTVAELAELCGGTVEGDGSRTIVGPAGLDDAGPEHVSFLAQANYAARLADTAAGAILVGPGVEAPNASVTLLRCDDPERVGDAVRACVRQIVRASTLRQAVAGLLSTSPLKTIAYVGAKFVKSAQSRTSG